MNQFKKYEEQLKKDKDIYSMVIQLDDMISSMWCKKSFETGYKMWRDISRFIDEPYRSKIMIEVHHVMLGNGIKEARLALKDEIEKYVNFLIEKYCS